MGTSNWQNIPYCIDVLMKIAPQRVLDVGIGFGRWGVILREFCDVWSGRIHQPDWFGSGKGGGGLHIEGIEGFEKNIAPYHAQFYNKVHIGDATELLPRLLAKKDPSGPWNLVMFGDVLEHFSKDTARRLLNTCLDRADYIIVNIPLGEDWEQGDAYGNPFERHLSSWEPEEFEPFHCVRRALFVDYLGRPFGSFCLSRRDPRNVRESLFSPVAAHPDGLTPEMLTQAEQIVRRVRELADELAYVKSHSTYRLGERLRKNGWWNRLRWLRHRNDRVVTLRALGEKAALSHGTQVWLLAARPSPAQAPVPWDFVEGGATWLRHPAPERPYGQCLMTHNAGKARVPVDHDPELSLLAHSWSGIVEVAFKGRREVVDLFAPVACEVILRPGLTPMRQPALPVVERPHAPPPPPAPAPITSARAGLRMFSPADDRFIEQTRAADARVVAVSCPRWLGVTSSTRGIFPHCYPMPATREEDPFNIPQDAIDHHAAVLAATGASHFVASGGDESQLRLLEAIDRLRPGCRLDLFWHGSYVQFSEDHTFRIFKMWVDAARRGFLSSIATDKMGQDRFFQGLGIRSAVLLNRVDGDPMAPATDLPEDERHVGLWLSGHTFRKNPHAILSALKIVPNVHLHAAGVDPRSREVIDFLGIPTARLSEQPIPHDDLFPAMRKTHCTMYVTFAECCPMLPLESLRMGVPCLVGPVSHLFEDNPYLFERLVVPSPDRAEVIADYLVRAIDEREGIVAEYRRYHPVYEARCRAAFDEFMNLGAVPSKSGPPGLRCHDTNGQVVISSAKRPKAAAP